MHAGEIQDRGVWERDSILVSRASVSFSQEVAVPGIILSFFFLYFNRSPLSNQQKEGGLLRQSTNMAAVEETRNGRLSFKASP